MDPPDVHINLVISETSKLKVKLLYVVARLKTKISLGNFSKIVSLVQKILVSI